MGWHLRIIVFAGCALALGTACASAKDPVGRRSCGDQGASLTAEAHCPQPAASKRAMRKAKLLERLQRMNLPPQAKLSFVDPSGGSGGVSHRIGLDASQSSDSDGFVEHYSFQLFDADSGEPVSVGVRTRNPFATLTVTGGLPARLSASVTVEDDLRATDTTELVLAGSSASACQNALIRCQTDIIGQTFCSPIAGPFTTDDVLDAAQQCSGAITKESPAVVFAVGGAGGRGANGWPTHGGAGGVGGVAAMATTLALMDEAFGPPGATTYCFGFGEDGSHGDSHSGAGGASSILRTCEDVSQTETTGLLLLAGGGGGGSAGIFGNGYAGGAGGVAFSSPDGPCPPSCASGSSTGGAGAAGAGDWGGGGGGGGLGGEIPNTTDFAPGYDGIGGLGGETSDTMIPAWSLGTPGVSGRSGAGGSQVLWSGGSGGGGYGGGSSGTSTVTDVYGGGGGGSFAAASFRSFTFGTPTGSRIEFVFGWPGLAD